MSDYGFVENVATLINDIPAESIVSRKVMSNDDVKATLFGFAQGEALTEHTAAFPAILHFLEGEATVGLGEDTIKVKAGSLIYMPANLPHSVVAETAVSMLLYLIPQK